MNYQFKPPQSPMGQNRLQRGPKGSKCGQKGVNVYQNALNWVPSGLKWHQHELKWVKIAPNAVQSGPTRPKRVKMASKWVKKGLKRAFFRTARTPPKYAKTRLFCLWGTFVLVIKRRAHCAVHLWRQNVAVHRFSRCFNTSTSGVQRKSNAG